MPRARKKGERPEPAVKRKMRPAKLEQLHPKPNQADKYYNDLAKLPDENPFPVMRIHKNGTVLYANKASEPLLKVKDSITGRPAPAKWNRLVKKALSSGQVLREEIPQDSRIFAFRVVPISGSDYVNFYGVDITEQKKTEGMLRKSEKHFRMLADIMNDGLGEIDENGRYVYVNRKFGEILGYSSDKMFGRHWSEFFDRDAQEIIKAQLIVRRKGLAEPYEFATTRKDGRKIYIRVSPQIIYDQKGKFKGSTAVFTDITERNLLGETLEKERQELNLIIDSSPIIVFYKDKEGKFVRVNKAFAEALNIPKERFLGKTVFDFYSKQIAQAMTDDDREVFTTGRPKLNILEKYESAKGLRWVQTYKIPIFDKNGDIAGTVGFAQDITERKRAELALRTNEEQYRTILQTTMDGFWLLDMQGHIIEVNDSYCQMSGYSRDELLKMTIAQLEAIETPDDIARRIRKIITHGADRFESAHRRKNGSIFQVESSVHFLPTEEGRFFCFFRDITERKRAEEQLLEERNLLRILIDHIPDPVYLKDTGSKFVACNKALCKIFGLKNDREVIGKTDFDFFEKQQAQKYFIEEQKIIQTSHPIINREGQYPDKERTLHSFLTTKLPIQDSHGNVTGTIGINRDITERKIAENQLLDYSKQLKKLASRLALTEERERRRIARDLHDQVNQSLALIKIKLDSLMVSEKASPLTDTLKETNDTIEKAIQNTRSLTFDLSYPILYELGFEAAVSEWLEEQIQKKHGIKTEFFDDGLSKPLDDDVRVLLFRNIRELLINVIKHARADKVKVSITKNDDSIKIRIEDNGVGFNIDEITASRKAGFGLLSIRESISELGGSFEIDSKPGAGCKFTMTAPLKYERQTKE